MQAMAEAIVRLTRVHHYSRAEVLGMTPREALAILYIADRQHLRDQANLLVIHAAAAQGTEKSFRELLGELQGDAE